MEQGGERWSKPHVASLSLHSLFELRGSLVSGCVILEMDAYNMTQIAGTRSQSTVVLFVCLFD